MKIKPLQFVILALGGVAAIAALVWSFGSGGQVKLADSVLLVDVKTGQIYEASVRKRAIMEPATPPEGGEPRLIRVEKEGDKWFVTRRSKSLLPDLPFDPAMVDQESGEVFTPSKDIRPYTPN